MSVAEDFVRAANFAKAESPTTVSWVEMNPPLSFLWASNQRTSGRESAKIDFKRTFENPFPCYKFPNHIGMRSLLTNEIPMSVG
jgi:hypothetical protein